MLTVFSWENAHFHLGSYYDQRMASGKFSRYTICKKCFIDFDPDVSDTVNVTQCYQRSLQLGSKYVFQTVPRLLTLWLDFGASKSIVKAEK
jgi:serine/threonine-protein kinase ATR